MAQRKNQNDNDVAAAKSAEEQAAEIEGAEVSNSAPAAGRVVLTSEPEKSADQTSYPGGEADPEDPPVRTTRPDVPIVQSLATGAGQHVPPDPDVYRPDGRLRDIADEPGDED